MLAALPPVGPGKLDSDTDVPAAASPEYSSLLGVPASVPFSVSTPFVDETMMRFFTCSQNNSTQHVRTAASLAGYTRATRTQGWGQCHISSVDKWWRPRTSAGLAEG